MTRLTDQSRRRLRSGVPVAALALIAYIPLLLSSPGQVGGDTKSYLTIDPSRWLSRVAYVWQDAIGAGGVTHQNIGYLWPMGPWFWVFDKLGVPMWVAQRLWLGTVLFAAGAGVLWLMRRFIDPRIAVAAAFFYMLSPYLLHYSERMSVLLLPWAGLPWMVGLTAKARREGTWKAPALFALLTATIGGINATSILLVGLGPILWLVYATFLPHSAGTAAEALKLRVRRALGVAVRIGALCALTNAWWIGGLRTQGAYGLPVLDYTETYKTVADASAAQEMLRGFGHWYFYGADRIGAWVRPSVTYTGNLWVLTLSFAVPILALAGLGLVRFRHRTFFLTTTVVGLLAAVGAHPWDAPSVLGGIFKAFTRTESGLALRSTPRALPLMELGLAAGFGAGAAALGAVVSRWWAERSARRAVATGTAAAAGADPSGGTGSRRSSAPRWVAPGVVALGCLLVMANLSPLWTGGATSDSLTRDEDIPEYWLEAAAAIDAGNHDTRVLEVPGSDFAAYRWGDIVDPLTPGLVDRPYLARELIPNGEPASAALLLALDRRYQEGIADPEALVPIARLFAVGDVVLRNDLQYERFNTPRPYLMWNSLTSTPGLAEPVGFGTYGRNDAQSPQPLLDSIALAEPADQPATPPVSLFHVEDALAISRTVPFASPMVVAGDAEGLVDLAGLGLLDPEQAILYAASLTDDPSALQAQLDAGATLVVTDTNAKRGLRWGSIRENEGYVERADESALTWDPSNNTLAVFPDQTTDDQTVAVQRGGTVDATAYGNPVSFTAENRPFLAFDGDPTTSWSVGAFDSVIGERIVLTLDEPTTIDHLTLLQAPTPRHITRARIRVGDRTLDVDLGPESRTAPGQVVTFAATEADEVSIEVLATDPGILSSYESQSGVGFAEITVPGLQVTETLRMPTDLLSAVGTDDLGHPLYLMVTRNRADPQANGRQDPETAMHREVELPSSRSFTAIGDVRLSPSITTAQLASLVGGTDGALVSASSALPGVLDSARSAWDGDPATWWTASIGDDGAWAQLDAPTATEPGELVVTFAADGRHSVPSRLSVQADGATVATVEVPDVPDGEFGTTRRVTIPIPAGTTGTSWRLTVDDVHPRMTNPWLGGADYALPVAIADIDGLDVAPATLHDTVDTGCRTDLVAVDGEPVPVRVTGTVADALARRPLSLVGCGDVALPSGTVTIDTTDGRTTGLDVDRLLLASETGGQAVPAAVSGSMDQVVAALQPELPATPPTVTVTHDQPDRVELEVTGLDARSWLVLGQSFSDGWTATSPELGDLGSPTLIQGYANGWVLDPATGTVHVTLEWGPQKVVWAGIGVSLIGVPLCLLILFVPWVRRRRRGRSGGPDDGDGSPDAPRPSEDPAVSASTTTVTTVGETHSAPEVGEPASPAIGEPWPPAARAPAGGWRTPLVLGAIVTVFAGVNLPRDHIVLTVVLAIGLGAATVAVVRLGRGLTAIGILAPAALAVAGAFTVAKQWHGDYKTFAWPRVFDAVDILGVLAVLALAAVAVISAWREERGARDIERAVGADDEPPAATT